MSLPILSRTVSSIECLEARIAPATVSASLAGATLKIVPILPAGAAEFQLEQIGPDTFRLSDTGASPVDFTGVKRLQIDLSTASDDVDIILSERFGGAVNVTTNGGADSVSFGGRGTIAGNVSINSTGNSTVFVDREVRILGALKTSGVGGEIGIEGVVGSLTVTNTSGNILLMPTSTVAGNVKIKAIDTINLNALGSIFGSLSVTVKGALGINSVTLNGLVGDNVVLKLADGDADVAVNTNFRGRGSFTLSTGQGRSTVDFKASGASQESVLSGVLKMQLGGGSLVQLDATGTIGGLQMIGGNGSHIFKMSGGSLYVTGRATFNYGDNGSILAIANGHHFLQGLYYNGKSAIDNAGISGVTIHGAAKFNLGDGGTYFEFTNSKVFGPLTVTGGSGEDRVELMGTTVHGKLTVNLRDGNNTLNVQDLVAYSRVVYSGGAGDDKLTFGLAKLYSTLQINAGNGKNDLNLSSLSNLTIFKYTGGNGVDTVMFPSMDPIPSAGFTRAQVKLGGGDDFVRLTDPMFFSFVLDGSAGNDRYQYAPAVANLDVTAKNFVITEEFDLPF